MSKSLVGAAKLLEILFPDPNDRPTLRTLRNWIKSRIIPCIKLGGKIYFDPIDVREAIDRRNTVRAR